MRATLRALALLTALLLSACGPQNAIMPAPLFAREHHAAICARTPADRRSTCVPVFYATNRTPDSSNDLGPTYSSSRCPETRLGAATVRIGPESWDWDRLNQETFSGQQPNMTLTHVEEFGVLSPSTTDRFVNALNATLEASTQKDIFVYIPGINLAFDMVLHRVAEFSHFLGRDGAFIAYAWPAHAHPFSYNDDRRCATDSVEQFTGFLRFLEDHTQAQHIHLLTSSAGAPVVSGALATLHIQHTRIGQVIFAASDQDVEGFRAMLNSGHADAAEHITVYASSSDLGLILSRVFGAGKDTIGRIPASLSDEDAALLRSHADRVTIVDSTEAVNQAGGGDIWSHRYWYANPWVTSDILSVLQHPKPPPDRSLIPTHDGALWSFPPDYPDRLRTIAP